MPTWLTALVSAVVSLLKGPLTSLGAYLVGQRQGRLKQERDQIAQDLETALGANAARRDAESDGLRESDPYNRDND